MSAIIHKFSSSNKNNTQLKLLTEQIEDCLSEELSELIGHMFNGADDILFQLAENADSNEDQTQYFDTMRMLRTERSNVSQNFANNINSYLQAEQQAEKKAFDEDELSLVDQSEMEELVAVSAMHSKAMNLYGEAVNHLEARIEFLSLKLTNVFPKDALSPKNICESFKDALSDIELSTNNKLILYKLFDQEVVLHLASLYKKLNQLFIDKGVLPQIKLGNTSERRTESKARNFSASTPLDEGIYRENPMCDPSRISNYQATNSSGYIGNSTSNGAQSTPNSLGGMQQEINRVASQFIQGTLTASGPGIPSSFTTTVSDKSAQGTQYYDRRDVMNALSNLQHKPSYTHFNDNQINIGELKQALLTSIGAQSGGAITKQVSQVDEKTIDLIEMLFNAIIDDDSIPELVTNLLLRLQIPVIKVAMLDEGFITSSDHPCKTTLNIIAHLGRGISTRDDELFTDLENIIDSILNEFDIDIASFETAVESLELLEERELNKAIETERKTQKSVLQAHARDMVLTELQHHVKNKTLAKPAQKLILRNWSTLMFHRYIKFGKDSDEWRKASTSIKQLIHLLQPIQSPQAYYTLDHEKDEIIDYIQKSLLDTKQNPIEIENEINNVYSIIDNALTTSKYNPAIRSNDETYFSPVDADADDELDTMEDPTIDLEDEINPLQEQARIAREKIAELASDIRPGVWFKVFNGEDSPARRAKLSVIVMEEAKLVFVDRVGVKVIEKDAAIFNEEIITEKSSLLADHSAFDHALGVVINSLSGKN